MPYGTIYVVSHGWHTGFIVPTGKIDEKRPALRDRFGGVPYYEIGWGDAGFYQAREITSGLTMRAMFWPTDTVLHIVAVSGDPTEYFSSSDIIGFPVTESEFEGLLTFIDLSFAKDGEGDIRAIGRGIYGESEFYQAEGSYFLTNTCNTWTAKGLKSLGKDITVTFKLTAGSIMDYLRGSEKTSPQ